MRLLQLARKLGVTQSEITEILLKNNIHIEGSNAKIDEESVALIMKHFGKTNDTHPQEDSQETETAEKQEPTGKVTEDITPKINVTPDAPEVEVTEEKIPVEDEELLTNAKKQTETEVIRAKKIKLEGIKVLGKIELPEPVKKEKKEEEEIEAPEKQLTERKTRQPRDSRGRDKGRKPYRKQKKVETFEQKQKRLEREALKKKREKEKKLKKKKKQYYEQTIKTEQQKPVAKSKKKKKKTVAEPVQKKKEVVYHKNPIKRLWAWLNGKYD